MGLEGIDVYEGTGGIEWHRVAAKHSFALIRGVYGTRADKMAVQNFISAKGEGLVCGLYHFYRVTQDPQAQLDAMLAILAKAGCGPGDLAPIIDVEDNPYYDGPWNPADNAKYIAGLTNWCAGIRAKFTCEPIIYTRASFWKQIGNLPGFIKSPLWVANYGVKDPMLPLGWKDYAFWQYADDGEIDGIAGHCDVNHFKSDLAALRALTIPAKTAKPSPELAA